MSFGIQTLKFNKMFLVSPGCKFYLSGMNKPKSVPLLFNCFGLFAPFWSVNFITFFVSIALKQNVYDAINSLTKEINWISTVLIFIMLILIITFL